MSLLKGLILCLLAGLSCSECTKPRDPVVHTGSGRVRGMIDQSITGDEYLAFRGIPYAEPPVEELRFEDPKPIGAWKGVREAKEYGRICSQVYLYNETRGSGEDCLFLNVFVRGNKIPVEKRPVMVWIHGGGWLFGDGDEYMYGPDYLMRKDIILVTFNYRLGVLGFLNLEDEIAPGNQGLQDILLVLKWIKTNIAKFGGDPDNVTIFGESSGGMTVHFLALSPAAKGLFHKVITESGNVFDSAINIPNPKNFAYQLVDLLGKKTRNHREIKEFLRTVEPKKIIEAQEKLYVKEGGITLTFPFGVGIDSKAKNPIIPEKIDTASLKGVQVPLLIGYNSNEALGLLSDIGDDLDKWNNQFEKFFSPMFIQYLKKNYGITVYDLKNLYFKNGLITKENRKNITDFYTQTYYVEGIHRTLRIQQEKSKKPTYYYVYTYDETLSAIKKIAKITEKGAMHTDELENLFRQKLYEDLKISPLQKGTAPYRLMEQMTEMWVNFAKTGNPTPTTSQLLPVKWLPNNDKSNLRYLNIGQNLRMEEITSLLDRYSNLGKSKKQ